MNTKHTEVVTNIMRLVDNQNEGFSEYNDNQIGGFLLTSDNQYEYHTNNDLHAISNIIQENSHKIQYKNASETYDVSYRSKFNPHVNPVISSENYSNLFANKQFSETSNASSKSAQKNKFSATSTDNYGGSFADRQFSETSDVSFRSKGKYLNSATSTDNYNNSFAGRQFSETSDVSFRSKGKYSNSATSTESYGGLLDNAQLSETSDLYKNGDPKSDQPNIIKSILDLFA